MMRQLCQVSQTDRFLTGTGPRTTNLTGVSIAALLATSGEAGNTPLNSYVIAAGPDGYGVVYSGGEINPTIHGTASALVTYSDGPTNTSGSVAGALRTTAPNDAKGAGYVSALSKVQVLTPNNDTIARLYGGAFGRTANAGGSAFWSGRLDAGATLTQIAQGCLESKEFADDGGAKSNAGFVTQLYNNLLGRIPDQAGANYWTSLLNTGTTEGAVLGGSSTIPEAIIHVASIGGSLIHTS